MNRSEKKKKAFVNSLFAIVVSALLLEGILYLQVFEARSGTVQQELFVLKYADYYFDDISYDLAHITPDNPVIYRLNSSTIRLNFSNTRPVINFSALLANYSGKIMPVAQRINVNISLNYSNMSSDVLSYYFSNGVVYTASYDYPYKIEVISSPSTNFQNYSISFSTNLTRQLLNDFNYDPGGNIYIKMNYTDANGTYASAGYLNSTQSNVFKANFTNGGQFEIKIQKVENNPGSFYIVKSGIPDSKLYVDAVIENNGTYEVYAALPIYLNITHFDYSRGGIILPMKV